MKSLFLILTLTLVPLIIYPQFLNSYDNEKSQKVERFEFKRLILNAIEINEGNFGSIDTKDSKIEFTGNIVGAKRNNILNISIDGGITEGFSAFLSGYEVNPTVGVELKNFTFLESNIKTTPKSESDRYHLNKRLDSLGRITHNNGTNVNHPTHGNLNYYVYEKVLELETKKTVLHEEIDALQKKIDAGEVTVNDAATSAPVKARATYNIPIWKEQISTKKSQLPQIDEFISQIVNNTILKNDIVGAVNERVEKKTEEVLSKLVPFEYDLSWLTIALGVKKNAFKIFDDTGEIQVFSDQIKSHSFKNYSFEIAFNHFSKKLGKRNTYFYSIGFKASEQNNLSALSALSIIDIDTVDIFKPNNIRTIKKETAVYNRSEYKQNLLSLVFFFDAYLFLDKKNKFALRVNPVLETIEGVSKINFNFGTLVTFKSKDKENPIINLEIISNLADVFNFNQDDDTNLFQKNIIGANIKMPFKYSTKK